MWIEIFHQRLYNKNDSHPPHRGMWIEILLDVIVYGLLASHPPHRGMWIEIPSALLLFI